MPRDITIQDEFGTLIVREVKGDGVHVYIDDLIRLNEASILLPRADALRLLQFLERTLRNDS